MKNSDLTSYSGHDLGIPLPDLCLLAGGRTTRELMLARITRTARTGLIAIAYVTGTLTDHFVSECHGTADAHTVASLTASSNTLNWGPAASSFGSGTNLVPLGNRIGLVTCEPSWVRRHASIR